MPFLGSNSTLFVGQAVADLYCSDYWAPAPVPNMPNGPLPPIPGGQWPWVRLRNECVAFGWSFFALEATIVGPNAMPPAIWNFLPQAVQAARLHVTDQGHFLLPMNGAGVAVGVQFAATAGGIAAGYLLPWGHSADVTHTVYPGANMWHYHSHHERPAYNHFSTTPIETGNARRHHVFPSIHYGVQYQFYRSY